MSQDFFEVSLSNASELKTEFLLITRFVKEWKD